MAMLSLVGEVHAEHATSLIGPASSHITQGVAPASKHQHGNVVPREELQAVAVPLSRKSIHYRGHMWSLLQYISITVYKVHSKAVSVRSPSHPFLTCMLRLKQPSRSPLRLSAPQHMTMAPG